MDVQRLVREEDNGWKRLMDVLADIPDDRIDEPTLTPEGWSAKDAMFHLAYWQDDCARVLASIAQGTFDPAAEDAIDIQSLNDEGFLRSRDMDAGTVRTGLLAAHERAAAAFAALETITPQAWEWFEESGPLHYAKHVEDLEAWLRG